MSLVIHFEQGTQKLNRIIYVPNNIAEIVHSDGITFYESMEDMHLDHPFENYLPDNYDYSGTKRIEDITHLYETAMILQYEIPVYESNKLTKTKEQSR